MARPKIPVFHAKPQASSSKPRPSAPKKSSSSTKPKASSGGGGGGSSKPKDPYAAAQAKADRQLKQQQAKAANRYVQQAESMAGQIAALRNSLGSQGFLKALNQRLANIGLVVGQQDAVLMEGYRGRLGALKDASSDNDKSEADASWAAASNRARERTNALAEATNNGAGESDVMRSQLMSLRNWDSNQSEINRSYFDTLRSVNSGIVDLNADTKTARVNMQSQANADRDQVWSGYYDQRSETLTQLGNLFGQQSELFGMAKEQVASKGTEARRKAAIKQSNSAFMQASQANATVHPNAGVPAAIQNWQGEGPIQGEATGGRIEEVPDLGRQAKAPEGAKLRKWTT